VKVGQKIILKNTDTAAHTFTAGHPDSGPTGEFDTGLLMAGNSFEFTPKTNGVISYFCMVHPWMIGSITVGSGEPSTPNPTQNPTPIPQPNQGNNQLTIETQKLKDEIARLKMENEQLKNQVNDLMYEIKSLKDQIVSMTSEFMNNIILANEWFRSQLS